MPLGDSNTWGVVPQGYRQPLAELLSANGLPVKFVGSWTDNRTPFANNRHEGYVAWGLDDLLNGRGPVHPLYSIFLYKPDYILLLAGTNDFFVKNYSAAEAERNMTGLLDKIRETSPGSRILVATLFPIADVKASPRRADAAFDPRIQQFNAWLRATVPDLAAKGWPIHLVDMYPLIDLDWLTDGIHANALGYRAVAEAWYVGLAPLLAAASGRASPACVADAASRAQIMAALRTLADRSRAAPKPPARISAAAAKLNAYLRALIAGNWDCKRTETVTRFVREALATR